MKISEAWLREWINPPLSTQDLANQLTMAGLEVESLTPAAGTFDQVVVAKVVKTKPHPQADRLTLCEINAGDDVPLAVVCGASNVRPGLMVALAKIGAHLPNGLIIKETKLRGELSQGMLCSAEELGLTPQSEGILELANDAPLGQDLRNYLTLDDHIFDLDLTPNRADCLSVLGVARDLAALNALSLKTLDIPKNPVDTDKVLAVHLNCPQACPRYVGRILTGISSHAATPLYMTERLRRADIRPIHPVVDILNYVMLKVGQPMHAFDLRQISGPIQVRKAQAEESLQLLGGRDIGLNERTVVIADDQKVLALAGIMGGEHSGVQTETTDIWLEAAFFEPKAIAGVARSFGLSTDASHRFERGVDPNLGLAALEIATALLIEIVGGQAGPIVQQSAEHFSPQPIRISFRPSSVVRLSGVTIAKERMQSILQHLGMTLEVQEELWQVTVPTYRFDLSIEADLVEEIIRIHGYDKIPTHAIVSTLQAGTIDPLEEMSSSIMQFLAQRGYQETISYSFVDPQFQQIVYPDLPAKALLNPISTELSAMRVGLWPGLLAAMMHNIHRQHAALKLCETGKVFLLTGDRVEEKAACAGLIVGTHGQYNWSEPDAQYDFYDMKGDLQALFGTMKHADIHFVPAQHAALHPGKTAKIMCGEQPIGWIGALHPRLLDTLDLDAEVIVFELMLSSLPQSPSTTYQSISKYPQIRRDLSLLLDDHISAQAIEDVVRAALDPNILKDFYIFDVYTGGGLADDHKKSVALGLLLQSNERTLVDDEIHAMIAAVVTALQQKLNAVLRTSPDMA
ncbi:MAG: phenylalanine--tRNA ligase subunit beta [Gammaproteobacteria bacterium]|nr:phenylalanine--tRNA ligase subunit beta [Gammaproteobacteria bacterium]